MANLEKHKRSLVQEWLESGESELSAQPRSPRVLGSHLKTWKPAARKVRSLPPSLPLKLEPALAREPGPPPKADEKHSQASSPEHLRKLQRLPKLRAPVTYKAAHPSPHAGGR